MSLARLLNTIPDEFKPLSALVIGAFLLVVLVLLHGAGLHGILVLHQRRVRRLRRGPPHLFRAVLMFGGAVFLMLVLHMLGFAFWAYTLIYLGLVPRAWDAVYFSANAYTTLGFGSVDLGTHWRNIAPIIGISGLFTFAWTASALVSVVNAHGELINRLEEEREQEKHMRSVLRKEMWDAIQSERTAERSERDTARTQAAGVSIFERHKVWQDERKRIKELRQANLQKLAELRRQERKDEQEIESRDF
jgi:hypothetical protein